MWKKIKPLVCRQGIIVLLAVCFVLLSGSVPAKGEKQPVATDGVLDLQQWSLDKDGPIGLKGKWEFYWSRFLDPEKSMSEAKPELTAYVNVPGIWNNSIPGRKLPADGFATYRLKVILNRESIGRPVGIRQMERPKEKSQERKKPANRR